MKKVFSAFFILLPSLFLFSCKEENGGKTDDKTAVLSVVVKDAQAIYEVAEHQSTNIDVTVTADPTSAEAYTITLGVKPDLVATYNTKNGTDYLMLPAAAYSIPSTTVMLPRYSAKSTTCQLRLIAEGCEQDQIYLLPVVIEAVKGGTNFEAPEEKAAYILFKVLPAEQEGSGTTSDPYVIKDVETFLKIGSLLKDDATVYFKMIADVDLSSLEFTEENPWTPFNTASDDDAIALAEKRKVVFDGNGHKLSNFHGGGALFGIFAGTVKNLTLDGFAVECLVNNAGGLFAGSAGTSTAGNEVVAKDIIITNSSLTNDYQRTGALFGWLKGGVVENVQVACTVKGERQVGGVIGRSDSGRMVNCTSSAEVSSTNYYTGGLVGLMENGTLSGCCATGKVDNVLETGTYSRVGGLVGEMHGGTVEKCYATGEVGGTGHFGGGLIGVVNPSKADILVSKCYATGKTSYTLASGNKAGYGALIGRMDGNLTITDCYATGAVKAYRWSSGFVGDVDKGKLTITNSYTTSDISAIGPDSRGNYECGALIGKVRNPDQTTINCTGFIAWRTCDRLFTFSYSENKGTDETPNWVLYEAIPIGDNFYGNTGTISQKAVALGWSTSVWDLSTDIPTLK